MLEHKVPEDVEREFICEVLPCDLIGMNKAMMTRYTDDRLLVTLGYSKIYNGSNPFDWMELTSLQGKTNFFEKRVGEYQKAAVMAGAEQANTFSVDEDF
mmetsp:Transcript_6373/g.13693  ORF Transcript_6373/g.13693 Transcript_6373/m.13693 type:complete len:99 (+) Transcript_6373:166-462(+)